MVKYDRTYALKYGQGDPRAANKKFIVLHATANPDATGKNEASFMSRNWDGSAMGSYLNAAYTHGIADTDRVWIVGEPGYVAWGAGNINNDSPYQIELAEYTDKAKALAAYRVWIESAREMAKKFGIPFKFNNASGGFVTHHFASNTFGGSNHQDPDSYLASIGISLDQLKRDLLNGVGTTQAPSPAWKENKNNHGIIRVNYSGKGSVRLTRKDGSYTDKYVKNNTAWKIVGIDKAGFQIGEDEYLPFKFAKVLVGFTAGYGVLAYDKDGKQIKGTNKKFVDNTSWKAVGGYEQGNYFYIQVSKTEFIKGIYTK